MPMLDWCILGECMVSINNIYNVIKEPTHEYQNYNYGQILIFGEYVKVRKSLYIRVTIWVNTILKINEYDFS